MAQTANSSTGSARQAALARRRAMSTQGKAAIKSNSGQARSASRAPAGNQAVSAAPAASTVSRPATAEPSARAASKARRRAMSQRGKAGVSSSDRQRGDVMRAKSGAKASQVSVRDERKGGCGCGCKKNRAAEPAPQTPTSEVASTFTQPASGMPNRIAKKVIASPARAASLARRHAMSQRGKAGVSTNGLTAAQTARAANPQLTGRELAKALRAQRSKRGGAGEKRTECAGRRRQRKSDAGAKGAADAHWKVGVTETSHGQHVTGTVVGRSAKTTGDEPGACRAVTGTEYMGADIFREFCQAEPVPTPEKVHVTSTSHGHFVTGTEVGRSPKVTGDEPGTCKQVTGTDYLSTEQLQSFCGTNPEPGPAKVTTSHTAKGRSVTGANVGRSERVTGDEPGAGRQLTGTQYMESAESEYPGKVGVTETPRGTHVTGTMVGRSQRVTGDEPGACRTITGDEYVGTEQYQAFCNTAPEPQDAKVGLSQTLKGKTVSGTMTSHSPKVTGDEPGLCKAITGTPYAGAEQYRQYCEPEQAQLAEARTPQRQATPGPMMTGIQPGLNGKMTGAEKGACEPLTGTPYVGADQYAEACPTAPAEPGSPDFPQTFGEAPWGKFSVESPSHAAAAAEGRHGVTGTQYEQGQITGPFGKASGKVTGTEEFRFGGAAPVRTAPETAPMVEGRVKPRVSGEGMDVGPRITGDDWDRGDRVTGTEGMSAVRRNLTKRGDASRRTGAMPPPKRNEEVAEPVSKVTGGSGNTEKGALITYSGGARG